MDIDNNSLKVDQDENCDIAIFAINWNNVGNLLLGNDYSGTDNNRVCLRSLCMVNLFSIQRPQPGIT